MRKTPLLSLILFVFYLLFVTWPLAYTLRQPEGLSIDVRIVNGLITASGILFALLTAIVLTFKEKPPNPFYPMIFGDFALLFFAGLEMFMVGLGVGSLLFALSFTTVSFFGSHFTAFSLLILRWQKE